MLYLNEVNDQLFPQQLSKKTKRSLLLLIDFRSSQRMCSANYLFYSFLAVGKLKLDMIPGS